MEKSIMYDKENGLLLDLYGSENAKAAIILIHGGGWFRGDKKPEKPLAEKLAKEDFLVVVPNYRLAPKDIFPAAKEDVLKVFEWLNASSYRFNEKIAAIGASAGGNLAVELALEKGIPAASWSGIIDLYDWMEEHQQVVPVMNQERNPKQTNGSDIDQTGKNDAFYKWFILNYVDQNLELLKQADPLQRVSEKSGPLFLANSIQEFVPLSGVYHLQQKLAEYGVSSEVKLLEGKRHGIGYVDEVYQTTLIFLQRYL
ncbi:MULTISPECIES: alpha/beta hydrolase [unclassified Enterococcus]|jgi:acetyl esterase|uniref:alpha/beta hydrolase n=1 Tax=unclassified Enterococcus TaxID=2608891 RepID=UPI003D27BF20